MGEPRDFIFGTLTYHSKSHPAEEKKLIGLCTIIPDHKSEKVSKTGAQLTKISPKQFSLSIYGISVISNVSNLTK